MLDQFVIYSFDPSNEHCLIFIPGYTGGLSAPIIEQLVTFYCKEREYDVLGLDLAYQQDTLELFPDSQKFLIDTVNAFAKQFTNKKIFIVAKSLGGSLALYNIENLSITGLVVLGCSVVLGWPQRVSLLSNNTPSIPDYKNEWKPILEQVSKPTRIITGDTDDLVDNAFLQEESTRNSNIHVEILKGANHGLIDTNTNRALTSECVHEIDTLL